MSELPFAICKDCGSRHGVGPGMALPASGGALSGRYDSVLGWQILEYVCGPCWAKRPKSDPRAYYRPDPYQLAKEAYWGQREFEALIAECDREYPAWRFRGMGRHEYI